ncbi:MAG: Type 1 glutamine amidotransferase-like domain-containing protein [Gallicola sp.]|nr:Type 1 glutamine amidotransferase-like domain-containing protein [Gallicola sp.]
MNVLMNIYNFHEEYARPVLEPVIKKTYRVLMIPFSHHEQWVGSPGEWEAEFGKGGRMYDELIAPFLSYGIKEKNIEWLREFEDNRDTAREKIASADIIYMPGGYPEKIMKRAEAFGIVETLRDFEGIFMGSSAGAMVQKDEYHMTPDDDYREFGLYRGLGRIEDFEIEVHYRNTYGQRRSMRRYFNERKKKIYAVGDEGGVLQKEDGRVIPFGDVMLLENLEDLENIPVVEGEDFYFRDLTYDDKKILEKEDEPVPEWIKMVPKAGHRCYTLVKKESGEVCGHITTVPENYGTLKIIIRFYPNSDERIFQAGKAFFSYIFENTGYHRIECKMYNDHSIEKDFLERVGFELEGVLEDKIAYEGELITEYITTLRR